MVRPEHVCCGLVLRQPQSTVLMAYQPGGSGAPAFSPTVSPGCVTEPARAGTAVQSDRTPAPANFVNLLFSCNPPHRPPGAVVWRTVPLNLTWSMGQDAMSDGDQVGAIAPRPVTNGLF